MKRIETILSELAALGVRFWLSGEQLHYRAPRGAMGPETMALLRARKPEIIAFLKANAAEGGAAEGKLPAVTARGMESGPLSLGQRSLWVLDQLYGAGAVYNIPEALTLRGPLDRPALEKSLELIVARQTALRLVICEGSLEDGREQKDNGEEQGRGELMLKLSSPGNELLPLIDLTRLAPSEREEEAQRLVSREANHHFELRGGALFRACLIRLGEQEHILCFTMHHAIADGWSKGVLGRELALCYRACRRGQAPELDPLPFNYLDFTRWQGELLASGLLEPHLTYWREQLRDLPAPASLPTDYRRPERPSGRGRVMVSEPDGGLVRRIKEHAQAEGCTLYMILGAIFAELVRRYRDDEEVVFGTPVANRPGLEFQELIGFFVNNLVLRLRFDGSLSFNQLLALMRRTVLDAFAHQPAPFEKVVEAVSAPGARNFSPIFQLGFVLQDGNIKPPDLEGLAVESAYVERETAKYDLSLIIVEHGNRLVLEWEYATDLFAPESIAQLAASFAFLAGELVSCPTSPLEQLEAADPTQRALVQKTWAHGPPRPLPELTLSQLVARSAAAEPHRIALVCGKQRLSYQQLEQQAELIAGRLKQAGIGPERIVGICLPRSSPQLIPAILGVLKAGGAYLPLEPGYPEQRLRELLRDSGARVLLVHQTQDQAQPEAHVETQVGAPPSAQAGAWTEGLKSAGLIVLDPAQILKMLSDHLPESDPAQAEWLATAAISLAPGATPDNLAYLIYTSGSTGTPKGVLVEHRSVANLLLGLEEAVYAHHPGPQQVSLFAAAVFDASVQQIFAALAGWHTLHLLDDSVREDPRQLIDYWRRERITIADGTPTLLNLLLDAGLARAEGLALERLLIGGEPLSADLVAGLRAGGAGAGLKITNLYGPTECCVDATALECPADSRPLPMVIPIGRPLVNVEVFILDSQLRPVAPGMPGELYIGGPGVARGYLGAPELSAQKFISHPFKSGARLYRTGDRARFLADGRIAFLGRRDNQVKLRGFRIELGEVEHALRRLPGVQDAVAVVTEMTGALGVTGISPDQSDSGRQLVAFLAVGEGKAEGAVKAEGRVQLDQLRGELQELLPAQLIPARFYTLPSLPRTAGGKVDRAALPALALAPLLPESACHTPPQTPREKDLALVWQAVLGVAEPGRDDNYFALGGDSIKALQVVSRLRRRNWQVHIRDIFHYPTIARLALHLKESEAGQPSAPVHGRLPLTAIQRWFFANYPANPHHFHQALLLQSRRRLEVEPLSRALNALQKHHDLLRARFRPEPGGGWRQEIEAEAQPLRFEVVEWRNNPLAAEDLRRHSGAVLAATRLDSGPLFLAVLYRFPAGDRLLLAAHHLVVDGVSWRILLSDLLTAYSQALAGETPVPQAKSASFQQWAEKISEYAKTLPPERPGGSWPSGSGPSGSCIAANVASGPRSGGASPYPLQPFTYAQRRRCEGRLSPEVTAGLGGKLAEGRRLSLPELLVGAFARAVRRDCGSTRLALMLEGHGREPIFDELPLDRTVGWFTTLYPVLIELGREGSVEAEEELAAVGRIVRRAAAGGLEFGLRRWLAPEVSEERAEENSPPGFGSGSGSVSGPAPAPGPAPLPAILFNYLGEFGEELESELFTRAPEELGPLIDPGAEVPFALELNAMIIGGSMELALEYGPVNLTSAQAEKLLALWAEELEILGARLPEAAADSRESATIEHSGLDREEVDSFLNLFAGSADAHK